MGFATGSSRHVHLEYNMQLLPLQMQSCWSCSYDLRCLRTKEGKHVDLAVIRDTKLHYKKRYFCGVKIDSALVVTSQDLDYPPFAGAASRISSIVTNFPTLQT